MFRGQLTALNLGRDIQVNLPLLLEEAALI